MDVTFTLTRQEVEVAIRAHVVNRLQYWGMADTASFLLGKQFGASIHPGNGFAEITFGHIDEEWVGKVVEAAFKQREVDLARPDQGQG